MRLDQQAPPLLAYGFPATFTSSTLQLRPPPLSCDTFVALPPATPGFVVFGKNSDRPTSEVQEVVAFPAATYEPGATLRCTYITIPQVRQTHAIILSKPSWMWGAEMAANSAGVCIGNEAVWTTEADDGPAALLGMDLVRLAAERASSAEEAVDVIGGLLEAHGQGGSCEYQGHWSYHNSFLMADHREAWVMETAGKWWVAERVKSGVRNISNCLSIRTLGDKRAPGLEQYLQGSKQAKQQESGWDFAACFEQGRVPSPGQKNPGREAAGLKLLQEAAVGGSLGPRQMMAILRDKGSGICMGCDGDEGGFRSNGSQVSVLAAPGSSQASVHWFTATPDPSRSVFKPYTFPQDLSRDKAVTASASTQSGGPGNSPHALWSAAVGSKRRSEKKEEALVRLEDDLFHSATSQSLSPQGAAASSFVSAVERELQVYQQN